MVLFPPYQALRHSRYEYVILHREGQPVDTGTDYLYISEDAGESWRKITREFGEIRSITWRPN